MQTIPVGKLFMEVTRQKSVGNIPYRIMDDVPSVHYYCIEYAKTFNEDGEIIYGWFPLYEQQVNFRSWDEVKALFDKLIMEDVAKADFRIDVQKWYNVDAKKIEEFIDESYDSEISVEENLKDFATFLQGIYYFD